jgi:hypothetical protein
MVTSIHHLLHLLGAQIKERFNKVAVNEVAALSSALFICKSSPPIKIT